MYTSHHTSISIFIFSFLPMHLAVPVSIIFHVISDLLGEVREHKLEVVEEFLFFVVGSCFAMKNDSLVLYLLAFLFGNLFDFIDYFLLFFKGRKYIFCHNLPYAKYVISLRTHVNTRIIDVLVFMFAIYVLSKG